MVIHVILIWSIGLTEVDWLVGWVGWLLFWGSDQSLHSLHLCVRLRWLNNANCDCWRRVGSNLYSLLWFIKNSKEEETSKQQQHHATSGTVTLVYVTTHRWSPLETVQQKIPTHLTLTQIGNSNKKQLLLWLKVPHLTIYYNETNREYKQRKKRVKKEWIWEYIR